MVDVEDVLRKAIEEGKFDDLPGKGRPLELEENPHEDPAWRLAYHILRNAGYLLPWIEALRQVEAELEAARSALRRSWEWRRASLEEGKRLPAVEQEWRAAVRAFREKVASLNRRIRSCNLAVPSERFQRPVVDAENEIERIARG